MNSVPVYREVSAVRLLMLKRLEELGISFDMIPTSYSDEGAPYIALHDVDRFVDCCAAMLADDPAMIGLMAMTEKGSTH